MKKQSDLQIVLEEYTELIKGANLTALLPFLKNKTKGHTGELKKHIRKAKTYWLTYVDLSEDNVFKKLLIAGSKWGMRASPAQQDIIILSAIALLNLKEITPWDDAVVYFDRIGEKEVLNIIEWAKPSWINQFILDKTAKSDWLNVSYRNIRILEDKGLIAYHPELFVRTLTRFNVWNDPEKWKHTDYIEYIINDPTAYQRDVPELFNYETAVQNQYFGNSPTDSYRSVLVWERIFSGLLSQNKIDRLWFIENCISIQTREWNTNLRSFFRKRLAEAKPTAGELLKFQNTLFHCLHSPVNAVANFGIDTIKNIYQEKGFHYQEFLEWVEPVMMRVDCKGGVKTLLGIFDKIIKSNPEFKTRISHLTADVFVIADLSLQERAFKTLEKTGDIHDNLLREKLEMYLPQMQGNMTTLISAFVKTDHTEITDTIEQYKVVLKERRFLLEEKKILPFENWNEILFQFGKFISSWEVVEGEKLVNAFITQRHLFPADAAEQLRVYSNQLQKSYFAANDKNWTAGMLVHIMEGREGFYNPQPLAYRHSKIINLAKEILFECQKKIKAKSILPLLSFPTHAPHWVDPAVLVERLLAYQEHGWEIDLLDFTIAISRMPRENAEAALQFCDKLGKNEASLIKFALGVSDKIELMPDSFLKKIFSGKKSENVMNHALWAVAARTFYPDKSFPEFESTPLKNLPNVAYPVVPDAKVMTRRNESKNFWTQKTEYYDFRELFVELPQSKWGLPVNLLYSLDVYERKSDSYVHFFLMHGDVLYWHSLMPQNDGALVTMILKYSCKNEQSGADDLNALLYLSAQPEFVFTETSMLAVACCMFNKDLKTRSYASEILIYLIAEQKINVKILGEKAGYLISESYGPTQRFTDVITTIRDVSSLHHSAVIMLLDSLFLNFNGKDKLPVNFKKLLEFYLDLLMKSGAKPDESTLTSISLWKDYNAIKSVLKQIQSL